MTFRQLFRLVDWLMTLPDDLEDGFLSDVHRFEEENKMEYLSSIERRGYKKGVELGMKEGLLEGISFLLDTKFGAAGAKLNKKVQAPELNGLREFARFVTTAQSVKEVRKYLG